MVLKGAALGHSKAVKSGICQDSPFFVTPTQQLGESNIDGAAPTSRNYSHFKPETLFRISSGFPKHTVEWRIRDAQTASGRATCVCGSERDDGSSLEVEMFVSTR